MAKSIKEQTSQFARNLNSLMKEKGMTIREAANVAGVAHSTINSWRSGAAPENFIAVKKLSKSLGVSFSYLLTGEDETRGDHPPSVAEVFTEGDALFDGYAKITIQRLIPNKKEE